MQAASSKGLHEFKVSDESRQALPNGPYRASAGSTAAS
jgi:hypothetical protein